MSSDWYLINPPRVFNSGFEDNEFYDYAFTGFNELLDTFLSSTIIVHNHSDLSDGIEIKAIVQNVTTDNINNDDMRQVLCNIGILQSGQYIEYKNRYWLVATLPDDNKLYEKAIMLCCNHYLQWKNDNGLVIGRYCITLDETKYTVGEKDKGNNVILGDTRFNISIPRDEETLKLKSGKRFLISNTTNNAQAYKLTRIEDVTEYYVTKDVLPFQDYSGIANLVCAEDQVNDQVDNKDLMIADYYTNTVTYKLELLNHDQSTPLLLNAGDAFQLEVVASKNGEICDKCDNWCKFSSTDESIATVDVDGLVTAVSDGNCEIIIDYFTEKIVLHTEVQSSSVADAYAISIVDADNDAEIIYGEDNDVIIKTYKNGTEDNTITFEYELINASGIASIKKVSGNVITILTVENSKNINKTFDLRVWNDVLGIEDIKTFTIVGWF